MMSNYFDDEKVLAPESINEAHLPVAIVVDKSGSMIGKPIDQVVRSINRFRQDICKDPNATELVDICIIAFNDKAEIVQDWISIKNMKPVEITADGGTNLSAALGLMLDKLKEREIYYKKMGMEIRRPYAVILSDGHDNYGNKIDSIAQNIRKRTEEKKLLPWIMGVPGYDKETAAKITGGPRVLELVDEKAYDFTGFFQVLEVSLKAASASAPGEKTTIKDEDDPLQKEDCSVKVVKLENWLD